MAFTWPSQSSMEPYAVKERSGQGTEESNRATIAEENLIGC